MFTSRTMQVKFLLATKGEFCVDGPVLPTRRRCLQMAASCGPNGCTQFSTVHAVTSTCRSANNHTTCAAESGRLQYHLTAMKITSGGQRYPENAEAEWAVKSRRQEQQW